MTINLLPRAASRARSSSIVGICRTLHNSSIHAATPISHPATPGPPPKPPVPSAFAPEERIERKRKQAALLKLGQGLRVNTAQQTPLLQKRFWKHVSVAEVPDGYHVMLDNRPVRTASRNVLVVPKSKAHLATAIGLEWDLLVSAQQALKHHYIPLTSLLSRALDIQAADAASDDKLRQSIVRMCMGYLSTDTILCWAPERGLYEGKEEKDKHIHSQSSLRQLQKETAAPIIQFLASTVWPGVELNPVLTDDSIMPSAQPEETTQIIRGWVNALPAIELAALERAILAGKSMLVGARLIAEWSSELSQQHTTTDVDRPRFTVEDAANACSLEVTWQTGMWGEVEDTHDVDKEDIRRQLGSVVLLVQSTPQS